MAYGWVTTMDADTAAQAAKTLIRKILEDGTPDKGTQSRFNGALAWARANQPDRVVSYLEEIAERIGKLRAPSGLTEAEQTEHRDWLQLQLRTLEGGRS